MLKKGQCPYFSHRRRVKWRHRWTFGTVLKVIYPIVDKSAPVMPPKEKKKVEYGRIIESEVGICFYYG